jgi:hypothetical protein
MPLLLPEKILYASAPEVIAEDFKQIVHAGHNARKLLAISLIISGVFSMPGDERQQYHIMLVKIPVR